MSSNKKWPRYRVYDIVYRFRIKYSDNIKELNITLKYLIKNILIARERIYLDIKERYNIELDNS